MDVLCIGMLATDILVKSVDRIDYNIDTVRVNQISINNGGDSLNTAISMSKLGMKVSFAGKVGEDILGDFLFNVAKNYGIDTRGLKISVEDSTTSCIALLNNTGNRTFLYYGGTNDTFSYEDLDTSLIDECDIVHVGGTFGLPLFDGEGASNVFKLAKSKGKLTSMDVTWDTTGRWLEIIRPCLNHLDFFMPSINEAKRITKKEKPKEIVEFMQNEGVKVIVIKLGKEGCYVKGSEEGFYFPAFDVNVIDTTGAGDSFVAGFLTGVLKKWELRECAQFASAVSAFCIQQIGATTNVSGYDEVIRFIENYKNKKKEV